jgi:uncharacterized protein involved in exopolysaccharide biosynthesis
MTSGARTREALTPSDGGYRAAASRGGWLSNRRLLVVAVALVVVNAVLAGMYSASGPAVYAAQADLIYNRSGTSPAQDIERELATQQVLLASRSHISEAAEAVGLEPGELSKRVEVEVVEDSRVLRLRVQHEEPERALRAAQDLVEAYQATVAEQSSAVDTSDEERRLLQERIAALEERLGPVQRRRAEIGAVDTPSAALSAELRDLEEEAGALRQQIAAHQLEMTNSDVRGLQVSAAAVEVLTPPFVLDDPIGPQPLRAAVAGLLVGILYAAGLWAAIHAVRQRRQRLQT